ncbi:MAG: type VII secretion protein EsaA [Streptococcaceae bacterium]|nr:type VII secretion protein EsaA [Streptococcaceae bacterium]
MKRKTVITGGILVIAIIGLGVSFWWLSRPKEAAGQSVSKPTIVLVNEDESGKFEGKSYNFGKSFVDLVSNDDKYNWQVASRSVAERAYKDGSVNAVIYLPQNFTSNLLSLQALAPEKAEVNYKIETGQNQVNNVQLDNKINGLLYDFNTRIVQMYYSSVANNVSSAQGAMQDVVGSQGTLLNQLGANVLPPFKTTAESYTSTISQANSLKSQNSSWIQSQNSFTSSVQNMLDSTSKTLNSQQVPLQNFFKDNQKIAQINVEHANAGITHQFTSDTAFYFDQFKGLYTTNLTNFNQFSSQNSDGTSQGVYPDLTNQIAQYNTLITEKRDDIGNQITQLAQQRTELFGLEQDVLQQFFASDISINDSNYKYDNLQSIVEDPDSTYARKALAEKLEKSFTQESLLDSKQNYSAQISSLLEDISVNSSDYTDLFNRLVENNSLTQEKADEYQKELNFLKNYASAFGVQTGELDEITLPDNTPHQTMEKTVTLKIPKGNIGYVKLTAPGTTISVSNVSGSGENNPSVSSDNTTVTLNNQNYTKEEPALDANGKPIMNPDGTVQMVEKSYSCAGDAVLTVTYSVDFGSTQISTATLTTYDGSSSKTGTIQFVLNPEQPVNNAVGQTYFETLTSMFNKIDTSTQLINFIYGNPEDDSLMVASENGQLPSEKDFQDNNENSVYNRYGNMDINTIQERLGNQDVTDYQDLGQSNLKQIIQILSELQERIDTLSQTENTLSENLPSSYFATQMTALQNWYNTATKANDESYKSWKDSKADLLAVKNWNEYNQTDPNLYIDPNGGDSIYKMISSLMTSTSKSATDTANNAKAIKDNSNQFEEMVKGVNVTKANAQKVLDGTGEILSVGTKDLKKSKDYSTNFSTVLANTRAPGVNPIPIYNFFAQPLTVKNITPKAEKTKKQTINLIWIPALFGGIIIGGVGMYIVRRKA